MIILKNLAIGVGIAGGLFLLKHLKPLFKWIKDGIEDGDGILENKELQIAVFSLLAVFMIISKIGRAHV